MENTQTKAIPLLPMVLVYSLFFTWGFVWNLFNVLASFFKETFDLSNTEISLGTSLSFLAFFLMAYPSKIIIGRLGTQNAVSLGSFIAGLGLLLFIPASYLKSYWAFLAGLFVLFSGITILQTVCNPYIGILGDLKNRAARINFAQGIGAVGAALTAPLGGWFMLELFGSDVFAGIKWFYLFFALVFLLLALLTRLAGLPQNPDEPKPFKSAYFERSGVFRYRHFTVGFVIMFLYMGAEAILYQLMTPYFKEIGEISTVEAVRFSAILFYGLMVGRLLGAWTMTRIKPNLVLGTCALVAALLVSASIVTGGRIGIYSITATGLFISVMFASIFSLATTGLGRYTNQASALLVMGISGGFFVPLVFGIVADSINLRASLMVVVIPLLLTALYGFWFKHLKNSIPETLNK